MKKGFTLIELLVVIAILGTVLVMIAAIFNSSKKNPYSEPSQQWGAGSRPATPEVATPEAPSNPDVEMDNGQVVKRFTSFNSMSTWLEENKTVFVQSITHDGGYIVVYRDQKK